jgi:hypothetical protein
VYIFYNTDQMYYKIIFNIKTNNKANNIARCIYDKIKNIRSENKEWLVNSTNGYIFAHVELPLYEKEYLESVIYEYGIQKAIEKFIVNKKCYEVIMNLVDNDEKNIYLGLAYYIVSEQFEYMSFEYVASA